MSSPGSFELQKITSEHDLINQDLHDRVYSSNSSTATNEKKLNIDSFNLSGKNSTTTVPRRMRASSAASSLRSNQADEFLESRDLVFLQDHLKQMKTLIKSLENIVVDDLAEAESSESSMNIIDHVILPNEISLDDDKTVKSLFDMFDLGSKGKIEHSEMLHFLKHVSQAYRGKNQDPPFASNDQELTRLVHEWFANTYAKGKMEMDLIDFAIWIKSHPEIINYIRIVDEYKDINIWTELLSPSNFLFEGTSGELKAASLNQLVERLTNGTITNLQHTEMNVITFSKCRSQTSHSENHSPYSPSSPNGGAPPNTLLKRFIGRERSSSLSSHKPAISPETTLLKPPVESPRFMPTDRRRGGIQHTQNVDVVVSPHGSGGQISIRETGEKFEHVFLLTFPSFVTPEMFLQKLLERFDVPGHVEKVLARRIQIQVCKVLLRWMQTFPKDFNRRMLDTMRSFLGNSALAGTFEFASLMQLVGSFIQKGSLRSYPFVKDILKSIAVENVTSQLHIYYNCFTGQSLLKAILECFPGYNNHSATSLAKELVQENIIVHIHGKPFSADTSEYYQFHYSLFGLGDQENVEFENLMDVLNISPDQFTLLDGIPEGEFRPISHPVHVFKRFCDSYKCAKVFSILNELHQVKKDNPDDEKKLKWVLDAIKETILCEGLDGRVVSECVNTVTFANNSQKLSFGVFEKLYGEMYEYFSTKVWPQFKKTEDWVLLWRSSGLNDELLRIRPLRSLMKRAARVEQQLPDNLQQTRARSKTLSQRILSSPTKKTTIDILEFDESEIAKQWTLYEQMLYENIERIEFLNLAWSKPKTQHLAKNLIKFINRFNEQSLWISTTIVETKTLKARVKIMEKFIKIMDNLKQMQNYSGMMSIFASLNSAPISRLKHTKSQINKAIAKMEKEIEDLMASDQNYKVYREAIQCADMSATPTIPYIGLFLTDLTFIEDGNAKKVAALINISQRTQIANVLAPLLGFQERKYLFKKNEHLYRIFQKLPTMNEDDLYKHSLEIEPRGSELKDID